MTDTTNRDQTHSLDRPQDQNSLLSAIGQINGALGRVKDLAGRYPDIAGLETAQDKLDDALIALDSFDLDELDQR